MNTGAKTLAAASAFACKPALSSGAAAVQRGFVPQRQLVRNVLDLDNMGRDVGWRAKRGHVPVLALFDFRAAFPSVSRTYLSVAVQEVGAPPGFCDIVHGLQDGACAQFCSAGAILPLFPIERGSPKAAPSRASLSVALARHRGLPRACADDVGAVLRRLVHLRDLFPVFVDAESVAGLPARPDKCVPVPLDKVPSDREIEVMRSALARAVPKWSAFAIRPAAT